MKKNRIPSAIAIAIALAVSCAMFLAPAPAAAADGNGELGRFEFDFNPLGFLQFGPLVNAGVRLGPVTYIDLHGRWSYAGALYWVLEDADVQPESFGLGVRVNNVFKLPGSMHAWYLGALFESTWGKATYEDDTWTGTGTYERTWRGYVLAANGGFRWRFQSGFYMNLGLILGIHNQYEASTDSPVNGFAKDDDPEGVRVFGMLEFAVGAEF